MNKTTEALKLAEEALSTAVMVDQFQGGEWEDYAYKALASIREALAEPDWYEEAMRLGGLNAKHVGELKQLRAEPMKQEPVAVVHNTDTPSNWSIIKPGLPAGTELYAAPVQPVKQEPVAWFHKIGCRANAFGECDMGCQPPVDAKAIRALKLVYDNSTSHDWPEDIWNAIVDALYDEHRKTMLGYIESADAKDCSGAHHHRNSRPFAAD